MVRKTPAGEAESFPGGKRLEPFQVHLLITRDEEDSFSAIALNLPGAGSCGATAEEAEAGAVEAIRAVLESYREEDAAIPWCATDDMEIPTGAEAKWITIHV